ncbi:MAG: hypothetical protein K2L82_14420 [Lachnospiraceae bacterium]|nr:hypothetical protein [Lachnospiraceae bacterium]
MKYTAIDYDGIRKEAEQNEKIMLTDQELLNVVFLCTRKIELNRLEADYMNVLLPDEIRHYAIRREVNTITILVRKMEEMEDGTGNYETVPCRC